MDRGQFVTGLDSTRASAVLDSQSSPSVTRLFEDRMQQGMPPPSPLSFQAIHAYRSPFFASSRILDSGGSGRGFVTADGATPSRLSAIALPRTADGRPADARTPDAHLPASDPPAADELEFEDFTAALLTMRRQSGTRLRTGDFGGDDVQRNLFATPEGAGYRLAHARGSDNLRSEDVNFVSDSIMNSNSPAFPEAFSGAEAQRAHIDCAEAVSVSGVASRTGVSRPLDSSVVGTVGTPPSGYLDAIRAADVIKAPRGRHLQGDAADAGATPPSPASPRPIDERPHSDPLQLHEYAAASGTDRGLAPSSGGPSPGLAPRHGRGRGGMMSVPPRTEGLGVRWTSETVDGRGLVPTNLFGQDESCVLAQFRAFVRQVPESDVGKRCASLVQKRSEFQVPYALWVNPQGLFMRVQVKSIVEALSSPRVKVHIRLDQHAFATFGEIFCDDASLQYKAFSEVPISERPPSLADGLAQYMRLVDEKAREADEAPSTSVVRREVTTSENGVRVAEEMLAVGGGGGGGEPFGNSRVGNSPDRASVSRPIPVKFDPSKIGHFMGSCEVAPREQYHKHAEPWIRRMLMTLKAQNIPLESYVQCALLCMDSTAVAQRYQFEEMKRQDYPSNWFYDEATFPPRPESLRFRHFAQWLIRTFTDAAVVEEQRAKFADLKQGPQQSVFLFNETFNYERTLLHQLNLASYLMGAVQETPAIWDVSMNPDNPWMIVEDARDTLQYIKALTKPLRDSVSSWHTNKLVEHQLAGTEGGPRAHPTLEQVQQEALKFERVSRMHSGYPQGAQVGAGTHSVRAPLAITNGTRGWAAATFRRRIRARDPSPPARLRINNIESEPDEAEDDTGATDLERLYVTMAQEGKVSCSRAQLKMMMDKNLCFKCAKTGHRAPECRNDAVNPKTFRLTHLSELAAFDEENDDLFHALLELEETQGGAENGSASR
jgi:hypothetical protein